MTTPGSGAGSVGGLSGCDSISRTMKRDPSPGALSTRISPPMICTSACVIARPSPTPGRSPAGPATRSNGAKIRSASPGAMPMPVSITVKVASWLRYSTLSMTDP